MSNRIFLDTCFVLALVNPKDQYHSIAIRLAKKYLHQPCLITDAVILEIGNSLAKSFKQEAIEVIQNFFSSKEVEVVRMTSDLFEKAFEFYKDYEDKQWGLVDCLTFVVMMESGLEEALTFDHHFQQAGFRALMAEGS